MGKDLRGKELGVGLSQRKDGLYSARTTDSNGKRVQKYFTKLQECKQWLADYEFQKEHGTLKAGGEMTVDAWFEHFISIIKQNTVRAGTIRQYKSCYNEHVKDVIGNYQLKDVKSIHCMDVLNKMVENGYRNSYIDSVRAIMNIIFQQAVENDLIIKNPIKKSVKCKGGADSKEKRVLTIEEQKAFLMQAKKKCNYISYAIVLQTGVRAGELIALLWSDIDFKNNIIHINKTAKYNYKEKTWEIGPPKSENSNRIIPMTRECRRLLFLQKEKLKHNKAINLEYKNYVFLNRNGHPIKNVSYDGQLNTIADEIGIKRFSMHTLRHTFATRCIESGMKPKTLQMILGHYNISVTMNLYVHVTEDEKKKEMDKIAEALKVV